MPKTVTGDEAGLVGVLLQFANDLSPDDPADVEAHFRQHPWCGVPVWQSITPSVLGESDPSGERTRDAALAFQSDHAQVRATLHRIATADWPERIRLREDVQNRLQSLVVTGRLEIGSATDAETGFVSQIRVTHAIFALA